MTQTPQIQEEQYPKAKELKDNPCTLFDSYWMYNVHLE